MSTELVIELRREIDVVRSDVQEVKQGLREILAFQKSIAAGFKFMIGLFIIGAGSLSGVVYLTKNNRESLEIARHQLTQMRGVSERAIPVDNVSMYCPNNN